MFKDYGIVSKLKIIDRHNRINMEPSQVEQLLAYLNNQNVKVKNEALAIVLQLTGTKESRTMLRKPEVTKQLLRSIPVAV